MDGSGKVKGGEGKEEEEEDIAWDFVRRKLVARRLG